MARRPEVASREKNPVAAGIRRFFPLSKKSKEKRSALVVVVVVVVVVVARHLPDAVVVVVAEKSQTPIPLPRPRLLGDFAPLLPIPILPTFVFFFQGHCISRNENRPLKRTPFSKRKRSPLLTLMVSVCLCSNHRRGR